MQVRLAKAHGMLFARARWSAASDSGHEGPGSGCLRVSCQGAPHWQILRLRMRCAATRGAAKFLVRTKQARLSEIAVALIKKVGQCVLEDSRAGPFGVQCILYIQPPSVPV